MALLTLLLLGCSADPQPPVPPAGDSSPDVGARPGVELSASTLDFGVVSLESAVELPLTIRSTGDAPLELLGLSLSGSPAFTVEPVVPALLEPGAEATLTVQYTPQTASDEATLSLSTSAPGMEQLEVLLVGEAALPLLAVEPAILDFGEQVDGCVSTQTLTLLSKGTAPVTVSSLAAMGTGFALTSQPALPLVLEPGEELSVEVSFGVAGGYGHYGGTLVIEHDAQSGQTGVDLSGDIESYWDAVDVWRQGPFERVDVIVWGASASKMSTHYENLSGSIRLFTDALDAQSIDWQMGVTSDTGCVSPGILTTDTEDLEGDVLVGLKTPSEDYGIDGFTLMRNAIARSDPGECNEGLIREGARTVLIFLSSWEDGSGRILWRLNDLRRAAPSVLAHAIANVPTETCTRELDSEAYYCATSITGGVYLDIYEDWQPSLPLFATDILGERWDRFQLTYLPDGWEVEVRVDGIAQSTGWSLDEAAGVITFEEAMVPATGSVVEVDYSFGNVCNGTYQAP